MKIIKKKSVNDGLDNKSKNPHIRPNTVYVVIGFDYECFRIINDIGEPILYPKELFDVIDPNFPEDWIKISCDDGQYFVAPPELSERWFYEDYFDGVPETVAKFQRYIDTLE